MDPPRPCRKIEPAAGARKRHLLQHIQVFREAKMEKRYVFSVTAKLFLMQENTDLSYSEADVDSYIAEEKPYVALLEDVANQFELTYNKCLQEVAYDPSTRTVTATLQILIGPHDIHFPGEDAGDLEADLVDYILDCSFEDGCYEGVSAYYIVDDEHAGVFDIRSRRTLHVELVEVLPGPTREEYEAIWRDDIVEYNELISYSEALGDFRAYLEEKDEFEKRMLYQDLIRKYLMRHIYGYAGVYKRIADSSFYSTDEERLAAFERVAA
jgi:hypothetical protein